MKKHKGPQTEIQKHNQTMYIITSLEEHVWTTLWENWILWIGQSKLSLTKPQSLYFRGLRSSVYSRLISLKTKKVCSSPVRHMQDLRNLRWVSPKNSLPLKIFIKYNNVVKLTFYYFKCLHISLAQKTHNSSETSHLRLTDWKQIHVTWLFWFLFIDIGISSYHPALIYENHLYL